MLGHALALPAAFLLDLVLGDPRWLPHPVRWMGAAIVRLEPRFRALPIPPRASGALFAAALAAATFMIGLAAVALAYRMHPAAGFVVETVALFYCLSARSLADAATGVERSLRTGGLEPARSALSMIVGRETRTLDAPAIRRAAVETVAENLVDGVLAPLFYAALGGAPLALAYKMVNTLDSMVGYKNERYREFGWASARLDDAAGFVPARASIPIVAAAAPIAGERWQGAWSTGLRDGRRHTSPNAGLPEAAFAGAIGVRLGGPNVYHGRRVEKPWIGGDLPDADETAVPRAVRLMTVAAALGFGGFWILRIALLAMG